MDQLLETLHDEISKHLDKSSKNPFVVAVDGNIGAGKSTICKIIHQYLKRDFPEVPLCHITESVESNMELFSNYISNQKEYGLEFQQWIVMHKVEQYLNALKETNDSHMIVLMDRSLLADRHVFFRNLVEKKLMNDATQEQYATFFEMLTLKYTNLFHPDMHITLQVDMDIIIERINNRNRTGEVCLYDKNYLESIEVLHCKFYEYMKLNLTGNIFKFNNNPAINCLTIKLD